MSERDLADAAQLASLADETPEGRSIVVLAKEAYGLRGRDMAGLGATFVPFTAQTRMSGVDLGGSSIRKGAVEAVLAALSVPPPPPAAGMRPCLPPGRGAGGCGRDPHHRRRDSPRPAARRWRSPATAPARVVALKDIVKGGIAERFTELRRMASAPS